jgi:hypothetical protein
MTNSAQSLNYQQHAEVLRRFGPDPVAEDRHGSGFWGSACRGMLHQEGEWRRLGRVFSWIDEKPAWDSAADWQRILPDPEKPCTRRFRLSLIGGGQIKVGEDFELFDVGSEHPSLCICYEPKLQVQAFTMAGLRVRYGVLSHGAICEMQAYAAVFPRGTEQDIVDRTAATLRLIGAHPHNFFALLSRGERCACCNRPLNEEISKLLGVGPDCALAMKLPHTTSYASRILVRRHKLLGEEAGS